MLAIDSLEYDAELLAGLRHGHDAAFAELVRRHSGRLLAVIRRLLRRDEDTQDALQETFLAAFRGLAKFDGKCQLGTWLHRIAVNAALMKLRSQRRKPEPSIDELLPTFYDNGHRRNPGPAWKLTPNRIEQAETRDLVRRAIDQLLDSYRVVLKAARHRAIGHRRSGSAVGNRGRGGQDPPAPRPASITHIARAAFLWRWGCSVTREGVPNSARLWRRVTALIEAHGAVGRRP